MYYVSYCFKYTAKLQQNVSINKEMIAKCFVFLIIILLCRNPNVCCFKMKVK